MASILIAAAAGAVAAYFVGDAMSQDITTEGPRINDLKSTTSSYGAPIKIAYGQIRTGGNIIWSGGLTETRIETQVNAGKGGGGSQTQVSYTYHADFAVGLCEGEIVTVSRIWADSVLIWDKRTTVGATGYIASLDIEGNVTIYPGSETQEPDPTIQAALGVNNTPAFRGMAYIVFSDFALEKFGNRIPNITAEVMVNGDAGTATTTTLTFKEDIGYRYYVTASARHPSAAYGVNARPDNGNNPIIFDYQDGLIRVGELNSSTAVRVYRLDGTLVKTDTRTTAESYFRVDAPEDNEWIPGGVLSNNCYFHTYYSAVFNQHQQTIDNVSALCPVINADGSVVFDFKDILPAGTYFGGIHPCVNGSYALLFTAPTSTWDYASSTSPYAIDTWYLAEWDGYQAAIISTGTVSPAAHLELIDFGQTAAHDWGAHMLESDLRTVWNHHVNTSAVAASYRQIDSAGNYDYAGVFSSSYYVSTHSGKGGVWADNGLGIVFSGNHMWVFTRSVLASANAPTIASIVTDLVGRAGVSTVDTQVSSLTDQVLGYIISRQMTVRNAIQPLQNAKLFDLIESDNKLKGVYRGSAVVTAIVSTYLGADQNPGDDLVVLTRKQDMELPLRLSISHLDQSADYNTNLQYAQRQNTEAKNDVKIELPIVLTATQAKHIAEKQLYSAWQNRDSYQFKLDMRFAYLEPGDVVTIEERGRTITVRITTISFGDGVLDVTAVAEDPDVYTAYSTGTAVSFSEQSIGITGPTNLIHMDIPLLRAQDDNSGYYAAFGGYISGWDGCVYMRSDDGGDTYNRITSQGTEAAIGIATDTLASAKSTIWDGANTVNIRMVSGIPESASASAVLNGTNVALLGDEIIAYQVVSAEADGTYTLSTLLRGLRGTEWAISNHGTDETFVVLNTNTIIRYDPGSSLIGSQRYYKAITVGKYEPETDAVTFTNNAAGLKPYSPGHFTASATASSNVKMSWVRRERTDGEWRDYVDVPLGETGMTFDLVIVDSSSSALRTVSAIATTAYTYSSADIVTDYGSLNTTIYANLYQISSTVGRGYPASAVFSITYP